MMKLETMTKVVIAFIAMVFVFVISSWIFVGVLVYKGAVAVDDQGLRGVVEQIWCGKNTDCKLPL